jgi:GH15 family glucan-1,4-alpha-glucosidase
MSEAQPPIADYALLGDCQSAALVSREGSIDWWCAPRFDSRSAFARLLDPAAGHWSIRPAGSFTVSRRYLDGTMVLETTFTAQGGVVRLTDAMALGAGARGHEIGLEVPHAIVRLLEAVSGTAEIEIELVPRLEYGLVRPELVRAAAGLRTAGGPDTLLLSGDRELEPGDGRATGTLRLSEGEAAGFTLRHYQGMSPALHEPLDARTTLDETLAGWRSWSGAHEGYTGRYRAEVERSVLVLQALTYQPTGAIVAAPTTSLPEVRGGDWNWDYRFSWLRDASLTLRALWVAACPDEAGRYFDWMARAAVGSVTADHVQIMFGVEGERDLSERELGHLDGYRGSRPVRIGNEAWRQKQLDVYGEVLDAAYLLRGQLEDLDPFTATFLRGLADHAADKWEETDAGIWEGREGERHYVTSKLLCWVALDRAVRMAPQLGADNRVPAWAHERDRIRDTILRRGWSEELGAYTGAFDSDHLDAGVLLMPIMGFLPADDERILRTIDAIERELSEDGLVQRWTGGDDEGRFVICSYWLANCLARAGEVDRACAVFEKVTSHANDVGLLAEEADTGDGGLLGNFPQAFSHVGLINAAWSIERAGGPVDGSRQG